MASPSGRSRLRRRGWSAFWIPWGLREMASPPSRRLADGSAGGRAIPEYRGTHCSGFVDAVAARLGVNSGAPQDRLTNPSANRQEEFLWRRRMAERPRRRCRSSRGEPWRVRRRRFARRPSRPCGCRPTDEQARSSGSNGRASGNPGRRPQLHFSSGRTRLRLPRFWPGRGRVLCSSRKLVIRKSAPKIWARASGAIAPQRLPGEGSSGLPYP